MDMRFIEVGIGLALVFALTSLLVTTLHEIFAAWRGSRGDNLVLALRSLLADDPHAGGLAGLGRAGRPPSDFSRAVLAHPLLVSQARGRSGEQDHPSYLPGDLVVSALLAQLVSSHHGGTRPETPREFVHGLGQAPAGPGPTPPPELLTALTTLSLGTEADWQAYERRLVAWYDSVAERSVGWFTRWTQYRLFWIGLLVAMLLNINPLVVAPRLWEDEPMRRALVAAGEAADQARQTDAAGDVDAARAALGRLSSDSVAQPAIELARQSAQAFETDAALAALEGTLSPLAVRAVDAAGPGAQRLERLSRAHIEVKELVRLRRSSVADHDVPHRLLDFSAALMQRLATMQGDADATRTLALAEAVKSARGAVAAEGQLLLLTALPDALAQRCRQAADASARQLCERLEGVRSLGGAGLPIGWSWENLPGCEGGRCRAGEPSTGLPPATLRAQLEALLAREPAASRESILQAWQATADALQTPSATMPRIVAACLRDQPCDLVQMLSGWIIVALGTMLGAPFWFDLLGRLVKLRGAGGRPSDEGAGAVPGAEGKGPGTGMLAPATRPGGPGGMPAADSLSAAEAALTAAQVVQVQRALGLPTDLQSGRWDAATRTRIAAFQAQEGLSPADGVLTGDQIERLQRGPASTPVPGATPVPVAAPSGLPKTPVRSDGSIAPLNEQEIRERYGDIATAPKPGEAGWVTVTRPGRIGGAQRVLVPFRHAVLDALAPKGCLVHSLALPHFQAVFDEIATLNLGGCIVEFGGTLAERHIGRDPAKRLSSHTWGIAIDLNVKANPQGSPPAPKGTAGSVIPLVEVFNRHGFAWGGHFQRGGPDGMHFELALRAS